MLLRDNLDRVDDVHQWLAVLDGSIAIPELAADERALCAEAALLAASLDWSADPWHALADRLRQSTGRSGRALFRPLRLALTGRDSGPQMAPLLGRIGRQRAIERLEGAAAG